MGLFSSKSPEERYAEEEAIKTYRAAKKALRKNQEAEIRNGVDYETWEFNELNDAFREAEKNVPRWKR